MLVFVADESMRYVAVNRTACETLGYEREELLALRVTDVAVAQETDELWGQMLRAGASAGTSVLRRKDGDTVRMRYSASAAVVAQMDVYVSVGILA